MRVAYFVNSLKSINWGGQATSAGIKNLVNTTYPNAEFVPLNLPPFPLNKIRIFRKFWEIKLAKALLNDDRTNVVKNLKRLNIDEEIFNGFDTVCFNGEGAIHSKSGHLMRLMGMIYEFKKRGAFVSALNQTVDLGENELLQKVVQRVYSMVDYLAVREPVSQRELQKLGLEPELVGDAAYALGRFSDEKITSLIPDLKLPSKFIAVTGSSYLKRNKKSIKMMENLLCEIEKFYQGVPIYFLANAKTDIYLANKLQSKYNFTIFAAPQEKYERAIAVIAKAHIVIGGRQHPNIFAAMQSVSFIPLQGNTHKMEGVVELLNYPLPVLKWNESSDVIQHTFKMLEDFRDKLPSILTVPKLKTICLSNKQ